jgi:hypothetical protein
MRQCQKRGVALVDDILIVAVVGLIAVGLISGSKFLNLFHSSDSKQKAQVVVLTNDAQKSADAAKAAQTAQAAADANKVAADQAKQARLDQAHEYVRGTGLALQKETNPSIYVQVAAVLNGDADSALDPLPADKAAEITALVVKLTSSDKAQTAQANQQLSTLQTQLGAEQAKESLLEGQQASLVAQRDALALQASNLQAQTVKDSSALQKWATDTDTLWQRFKSFIIWAIVFASLYLIVYWILPVLGTAYPAVAPIAKAAVAVMGWPLHALHKAELAVVSLAHAKTQATLATTQTQLASEQSAHAATTATLVKVALTPDGPPGTIAAVNVAPSLPPAVIAPLIPSSLVPTPLAQPPLVPAKA